MGSPAILFESDERQRRLAIDLTLSVSVQAPAGSGKTELLIQRFLRLLATVQKPEAILAITFTRKAAGEMLDRILGALRRAELGQPAERPHERLTLELAQAALARDREQGWDLLSNPNRLRVQTIDSLCGSIAGQMPWLARLGSMPRIEEHATPLYQEAARRTVQLVEQNTGYREPLETLLLHLDNNAGRVQQMIAACPHVAAIPMTRMPDALEVHVQHATDIGVLGTITATVDDVERARDAVKWSRYPPMGRRSTGAGQAASLWGINGIDYHSTINDNMLNVIMIETPTGVANAFDIASVPGVDVVIIGNADLASFSGYPQGDDRYWQLVKKVHDDVIRAGKIFGQASAAYATGPHSYDGRFFQNGPSNDGWVPPNAGRGRGGRGGAVNPNAPPEGEEAAPAKKNP